MVMSKDARFIRDFIKVVNPTNPIGHPQNASEKSDQIASVSLIQLQLLSHSYLHPTSGSSSMVAHKRLPHVKVGLSRSVTLKLKVIQRRVHESR